MLRTRGGRDGGLPGVEEWCEDVEVFAHRRGVDGGVAVGGGGGDDELPSVSPCSTGGRDWRRLCDAVGQSVWGADDRDGVADVTSVVGEREVRCGERAVALLVPESTLGGVVDRGAELG